jgi:hypothetical protein
MTKYMSALMSVPAVIKHIQRSLEANSAGNEFERADECSLQKKVRVYATGRAPALLRALILRRGGQP